MKRSFERRSKLPAFACELATFENLLNEMAEEFPSKSPKLSISVSLSGEDLTFESIEEIRQYNALPSRISNLSVRLGEYAQEGTRSLSVRSGIMDLPQVYADGPSEAWCAGLVEKTRLFARHHRRWYWFIKPWVVWLLTVVTGGFLSFGATGPEKYRLSKIGLGSLLIFWLITWYLFFSYGRIFKPMVLITNLEESWLKRYSTELTIAAAVVSALATLYSAFK